MALCALVHKCMHFTRMFIASAFRQKHIPFSQDYSVEVGFTSVGRSYYNKTYVCIIITSSLYNYRLS